MSDESGSTMPGTLQGQPEEKHLMDFIEDLKSCPPLTSRHQENVFRLIAISKKFHNRAGIPFPEPDRVSENTIVLESGHQPNFLPHSGVLKKAFLLSKLQEEIKKQGGSCAAFFGFADQNLSTAKLLYRTHIPAANKNGWETIGFSIAENDRNKKFCSQPKPPLDLWLNGLEKIKKHYHADFVKLKTQGGKIPHELGNILDIIQKSYGQADNFAEMNAIIFARICHDILGIQLHYFLHSELQKEHLFAEESRRLLLHYRTYNQTYNRVIVEKNLDIPQVHVNHLPFWYHCTCGAKIDLFIDESNVARGECPACYRKYALAFGQDFIRLPEYYARMDFTAVSRNIVWADGLGDALFVSGAGGSLRYGLISDQITKHLGFRQPLTLFWKSKDYYLGLTHVLILEELGKALSTQTVTLSHNGIEEKISLLKKDLSEKIAAAQHAGNGDKAIKGLKSDLNRLTNLVSTAEKNFTLVPSAIDLLVNQNSEIPGLWRKALDNVIVIPTGLANKIDTDITYPSRVIPDFGPDAITRVYTAFKNEGAYK